MTTGSATYSPEDNKLRLYIGRVPREEFLQLRAEGWTTLHKQREAGGGDFVATWTPQRRETALKYSGGIIEDEDMGPAERAADRAERFGDYRDKRTSDATGHADKFDAGPAVHGFQNEHRAERAAARHDRIADRAGDAWEKAEYWERRTAGVIGHALHVSSPGVRMGRIKALESEIRKAEKSRAEYAARYDRWTACAAMTDPEAQTKRAAALAYVEHGDYLHPRTGRKSYLFDFVKDAPREYDKGAGRFQDGAPQDPLNGAELCALWLSQHKPLAGEGAWLTHYRLRLAYEHQMLQGQGGRAAFVEMEVGGWIGKHQIRKVNKSPATGRVVSVTLRIEGNRWGNAAKPGEYYTKAFNIERLPSDAYTPPTDADRAALVDKKAAEKAATPKKDACPLINPTDADAERLQASWNAAHSKLGGWQSDPGEVKRITQAQYSANSGGTYSRCETELVAAGGRMPASAYGRLMEPAVCKVRFFGRSVIIITDKPQKPLPAAVFIDPRPAQLAIVHDQIEELQEIHRLISGSMRNESEVLSDEQRELFRLARLVGYAYNSSLSQRGLTDKAREFIRARQQNAATVPASITNGAGDWEEKHAAAVTRSAGYESENPVINALVAASESFA